MRDLIALTALCPTGVSVALPEAANADACRSERVTVPAAGGGREITVVRC